MDSHNERAHRRVQLLRELIRDGMSTQEALGEILNLLDEITDEVCESWFGCS